MAGQTLYFGPDPIPTADAYVIQWTPPSSVSAAPSVNAVDLSFSRAMTVAKGISVTVRSASLKSKSAIVQSYPTASRGITPGRSSPFGATQNYYFTMTPGNTPFQVAAYAQQKYQEIVAHEMRVRATLPGDTILTTKMLLKIAGTGTAFDQTYYPRVVIRTMSFDEGFRMSVDAQNQNTDTAGGASTDENPGTNTGSGDDG